jgi:hypothetical protein
MAYDDTSVITIQGKVDSADIVPGGGQPLGIGMPFGNPDEVSMLGVHEPLCRRCKEAHQTRRRLPACLRPLRFLGFNVRRYECPSCGKRSVTWR